LLALGVIGYGYWDVNIRPKGETVLQVGDKSFSLGYFERRVHYAVVQSGYSLPSNIDALRSQLEQLITQVGREELTRQGARELGITVTDQEIDEEIARRQELPSSPDRETFLAAYREAVRESGLSTEDFRSVIEASLLESKVRQMFLEDVADTAEQVRFRLIQVGTEEEAQDVVARLDAGEDFGDLARELSLDTASKEQVGERDWTLLEAFTDELKAVFSELEVGERSDPIAVDTSYVIVEPLEKDSARETTDIQKQDLASRALVNWLDELRNQLGVLSSMNEEQANTLLEKWVQDARRAPSG
jgi:parvulin-like peptidyl-prolyl isomerase